MKRYLLPLAWLIAASTWSCTDELVDKADVLRYIPAETSLALTIDLPALMEKVDFEWLQQTAFFQDFLEGEGSRNPQLKLLLADPAGAGIDIEGPVAFFVQIQPEDPAKWFAAMVVPLADAKAFAQICTAQLTVSEQDGYMLGLPQPKVFESEQAFVAWNEHVAWIGTRTKDGWSSTLEEALASLAAAEKEHSLASVPAARKALRAGHDLDMWATLDFAGKNPAVRASAAMVGIDSRALEGNTVTGWYEFSAGRSEGRMSFHLKDELSEELIARAFKDKPEYNIARHLPKGEIEFGMSLALNLIGIDKWLTEHPSMRRFVRFALALFNLSIEEAQQIFGGEVLIAQYLSPEEELLIGIRIKDEPKLRAALRAAEQQAAIRPLDERSWTVEAKEWRRSFSFSEGEILYLEGDILWLSPRGPLYEALLAGQRASLPRMFRNALGNYPFGLIVDFSAYPPLERFTLYATDGTLYNHITFTDKVKNSLRQIAEWLEATHSTQHGNDSETPL